MVKHIVWCFYIADVVILKGKHLWHPSVVGYVFWWHCITLQGIFCPGAMSCKLLRILCIFYRTLNCVFLWFDILIVPCIKRNEIGIIMEDRCELVKKFLCCFFSLYYLNQNAKTYCSTVLHCASLLMHSSWRMYIADFNSTAPFEAA